MDKIVALVEGWVADETIPGAVLDISLGDMFRFQQAFGAYCDGEVKQKITLNTMFDVASLTKVAATLPALLLLAVRGMVKLDDEVRRYLPAFRHEQVTIRHLIQHTSGLPADLLPADRNTQRDVVAEIYGQKLHSQPGSQVLYSDLGFILAGVVVEGITGQRLNEFIQREIYGPLGMSDTTFQPRETSKSRIAATERYGSAFIHGSVHDEKSFQLGGVCGSAGLFATAGDLSRYAQSWLGTGPVVLPRKWRDQCVDDPFMGRGLGWEVWQGPQASTQIPPTSCGANWPAGSYGHTGFTGTSLWIEPKRQLVVVFLTNAVHYGRGNSIRQLRPLLHEAIFSSLIGGIEYNKFS